MLKAGALYFAVISAFLIAVICASLIMIAAYYREGYLRELRRGRLERNMDSAVDFVLNRGGTVQAGDTVLDLFGDGTDSVRLGDSYWGIFELSVIRTAVSTDTLKKSFLIGMDTRMDTLALYLSDEDRPLSVSGDTRVTGDAEVPKSGMRKSYVENRPYSGDKLVYGKILESSRELVQLDKNLITLLGKELDKDLSDMEVLPDQNINASFFVPKRVFSLPLPARITGSLSGQIVLYSDTSVFISRTAKLDNILVYAQSITVEDGFEGNCQLFARDSIIVGDKVSLGYPSVLGLLGKEKTVDQSRITIGKDATVRGMVFTYEPKRSPLQTMISLGERSKVKGEVYATGLVKLGKGVVLEGKTSCNRFIMQTPTTLYENFLVDVTLNRRARDRHYLSSPVFGAKQKEKGVMEWLK
jgi:cytoskeletal protein CcmA (bactofilin family)